ncbi:MAG: CAP domain-containing protein [Chloroflexia bacterium]
MRLLRYGLLLVFFALALAALAEVGAPSRAQTGGGCQAFPQTGQKVCGRFLAYWQSHGGLAQQGYPISPEFQEKSDLNGRSYTVQYFERAVFELHPENQPPYDVLLSQLGTFLGRQKYPNGWPAAPPATATPTHTSAQCGMTAEEANTVSLINDRRAGLGLGRLTVNCALVSSARGHSNDIGPRGLCQHNGTDGSSAWDRIAHAGYTGTARGEVIGCGYASASAIVGDWWNDPPHYDVLANPSTNEIGCGWWYAGIGGRAWQTCDTGVEAAK